MAGEIKLLEAFVDALYIYEQDGTAIVECAWCTDQFDKAEFAEELVIHVHEKHPNCDLAKLADPPAPPPPPPSTPDAIEAFLNS